MRLLVVSDSHRFLDNLPRVVKKYKGKVDLMIHCGDSDLPFSDPVMRQFDIAVRGNHDEDEYPKFVVHKNILVTHGHYYNVYEGYQELIDLCKAHRCTICFHGHTHVPTIRTLQGITFVNPGSLMANRNSYAYGTYCIIDIFWDTQISFYRSDNDSLCPETLILDGLEKLREFKEIIRRFRGV